MAETRVPLKPPAQCTSLQYGTEWFKHHCNMVLSIYRNTLPRRNVFFCPKWMQNSCIHNFTAYLFSFVFKLKEKDYITIALHPYNFPFVMQPNRTPFVSKTRKKRKWSTFTYSIPNDTNISRFLQANSRLFPFRYATKQNSNCFQN